MKPADEFDVLIVGARCAGASLAALLAGQGYAVGLVDQISSPRFTPSSHVIQADAIGFLERLGVLDEVRGTGAPLLRAVDVRLEELWLKADYPLRPSDAGGGVCVRRQLFDPILLAAATAAGADVRMDTKVVGLIREAGRVVGARVTQGDQERHLRARLVVGADGRNSTVAQLCGARSYHVLPAERAYFWAYFASTTLPAEPTFVFHRWEDKFVVAAPADSGLFMVGTSCENAELAGFREDLEGSFMAQALACPPVAQALSGAHREGKILTASRLRGYFRQACGPGWALVGDAGHFKDPAAGRGIGDAFLQTEELSKVLATALREPTALLDRRLDEWARWRDSEFLDHYWTGADLGRAGPVGAMIPEIVRKLHEEGATGRFLDVLSHRCQPSELMTPPRVLAALGRLMLRRGGNRRAVLDEFGMLVGQQFKRQRLMRQPVFSG
jgi:2-polyprenyl-6-methoxyphenol hydroxylase-like FAD-dependent oxidoreductase